MTSFFQKNTLTIDEVCDMICYIATESLLMFVNQSRFPDNDERMAFWFKRIEYANYAGDCSKWHASKICVAGDDVARKIASEDMRLVIFYNAYITDLPETSKPYWKQQSDIQMWTLAEELIWRRRLI